MICLHHDIMILGKYLIGKLLIVVGEDVLYDRQLVGFMDGLFLRLNCSEFDRWEWIN